MKPVFIILIALAFTYSIAANINIKALFPVKEFLKARQRL